jgi:putative flavoprotein involved in K+ transport
VTDAAGLFFVGLTWQHTRGSALIGFVNDDATYIASRINPQQGTRAGLAGMDSERT